MQLWLVRHAQPLVESGVCYGALDIPADPQATAVAAAELAATLPAGSLVQHSTLQRCELLAQNLIGLRPDLTLKPEPNLREMNFGAWEGQRWNDIPARQLSAWTDDFENYRCGGAGESTLQFVERVQRGLQSCLELHSSAQQDTPGVCITHAGVMRAALWLQQRGLATPAWHPLYLRAAEWPQRALGFGQVLKLDWPGLAPLG
jgi:alpha-ribazole phosphatase